MANIVVTNAGLKALMNASTGGTNAIRIASVQFGSGKYTASETQTKLTNSFKTLTTIAGAATGDSQIHIEVVDNSTASYTVYEYGCFLEDGTLFAVYSSSTPILTKASGATVMLAIDITAQGATPTTVTFGDTNFSNPMATTSTAGVAQLATSAEALTGTNGNKIITPASLSYALANSTRLVHTTGAESIAGEKTFSSAMKTKFAVKKGETLSSAQYQGVYAVDASSSQIGGIQTVMSTDGSVNQYLKAYKNEEDSSDFGAINLRCEPDGSFYANYTYSGATLSIPTGDRSNKIPSTSWVGSEISSKADTAKVVLLSGDQTVYGIKTFTNHLKTQSVYSNLLGTEAFEFDPLKSVDTNDINLFSLRTFFTTDKEKICAFQLGNASNTSENRSYARLRFHYSQEDALTYADIYTQNCSIDLPTSDNSSRLATTAFVNSFVADHSTTSDETLKQDIKDIPEAVLKAWGKVNFKQFRYKAMVEEKGEKARKHIGVIAQQVISAFESEGLDATEYGLICWKKTDPVYEDKFFQTGESEDGTATGYTEKVLVKEGTEEWGIRYDEALALECAYQRWSKENMIADLTERINALEED